MHIYFLKPTAESAAAERSGDRLPHFVYARHGRELMGCKSPVRESSHCREDRVKQVLAEGKGVSARRGLEEAGAQSYEPTNRNSIQGHHPDKSAQHDEVPRIQEKW